MKEQKGGEEEGRREEAWDGKGRERQRQREGEGERKEGKEGDLWS